MRREKGFTLIELLVVIGVIALLLAILMPALQRVKRQAKAVVCQSNLHQWSLVWLMYCNNNEEFFPSSDIPMKTGHWTYLDLRSEYPIGKEGTECCPLATKLESRFGTGRDHIHGGTFLAHAWGGFKLIDGKPRYEYEYYSSYGINGWTYVPNPSVRVLNKEMLTRFWKTPNVKEAGYVPLYIDSCWAHGWVHDDDYPVEYDDGPRRMDGPWINNFCINRHDGFVNSLFMDWSVRKVGLKELWTLKWHREFNTAGTWTKAGGVQRRDWPEWMRRFKDY